ncbi:hypothetical protein [Lewinella sp. LCG006]|uniref:hypothetical protein n=1 Tax=Lewinella sp. LCG006 TaxID=3231911 RepID=UPI00346173FE
MLQMEIPNQPVMLAEFLEISLEALRKQMKRMGLVEGRFNRYAKMDKRTIKVLLEVYGQEAQAQHLSTFIEPDTAASGQTDALKPVHLESHQTDNSLNGHLSKETDKQASYPTDITSVKQDSPTNGQVDPFSKETDSWVSGSLSLKTDNYLGIDYAELSKDVLLALIAMVSMYVQMNHTAQVVGGEWLQAWAYALSIQFTGLAMTLYKGSLWYLRVFALAEFSINLLHYRPWACEWVESVSVCGGAEEWTRSLLLSALIAFTIYSYVEIFAARRNEKTDIR